MTSQRSSTIANYCSRLSLRSQLCRVETSGRDTEVAMKPPGGGGHRDHHHRGGDQEMVRLTAAVDGVESARRVGSSDASDGDDEEFASGDKAAPWWIRRGPCADAVALTQTMTYTLGFGVLGLLVGLIGPSLPTLRTNAGVAYERLGVVFLARWIGGVAGSAIGGFALDAAPRSHAPMCVGIVVSVIGAVRIPAARTQRAPPRLPRHRSRPRRPHRVRKHPRDVGQRAQPGARGERHQRRVRPRRARGAAHRVRRAGREPGRRRDRRVLDRSRRGNRGRDVLEPGRRPGEAGGGQGGG